MDGKLHQCSTMKLDTELRYMATELNDTTLLARISGGDIVAIEAKYHIECLVKYKNSYRSAQRAAVSQYSKIVENRCLQALVFAEVVAYIENEVENGTNIFKLSELHMIYENRLQSVGITITVNKTRFKSQLTAHFSDSCPETSDGRNTLLVFNDGFQKLLKDAMANRDIESEAIFMAKLVKTIRMDMLDWAEYEFNGKFPPGCQEISVPASLKALVAMLLNGCNVKNQETGLSQPCLTIAQLIFFNMKNRPSQGATERHVKHRQPPLPLFVGLNVHTETRSRKMVNTLYNLGISVSYQCVIDLEISLATTVCKHFEDEGLVCPPILRKGISQLELWIILIIILRLHQPRVFFMVQE